MDLERIQSFQIIDFPQFIYVNLTKSKKIHQKGLQRTTSYSQKAKTHSIRIKDPFNS